MFELNDKRLMQKCRKIQTLDASVKLWDAFKILGRKAYCKAFPSFHELWQNHGVNGVFLFLPLLKEVSALSPGPTRSSLAFGFLGEAHISGSAENSFSITRGLCQVTWPLTQAGTVTLCWGGPSVMEAVLLSSWTLSRCFFSSGSGGAPRGRPGV